MQVPPGPIHRLQTVGPVAQVVEHLRYGSGFMRPQALVVQPAPMDTGGKAARSPSARRACYVQPRL